MHYQLKQLFSKFLGLLGRKQLEYEFEEEIAGHIARLSEDFEKRGMSRQEAELAARRQFGGATQLREWHRENRSFASVESLARDVCNSLRAMGKAPGFALTVILMLALGIGANSAVFSLADQLLLQMLPVKNPKQLVLVNTRGAFIGGSCRPCGNTFSYPAYRDMRDATPKQFSGIAARYQSPVDISVNGSAQRAAAEVVSGNYFAVLGVTSAMGRVIESSADRVTLAEPYAVLSYGYWQQRFGGSPAAFNTTIDINGHPFTIIGVAQKGFRGFDELNPADIFVPMSMKPVVTPTWDDMERRNSTWLRVFARLRPGVAIDTAQSALQVPFQGVRRADLASVHRDRDFSALYMRGSIVLQSAAKGFDTQGTVLGKPILILWAMVGLLLMIACVNIASLALARAFARQKEMAVRLALGAGRASLFRLLLTESVLLAVIGALAGLFVSFWLSGLLASFLPVKNGAALLSVFPESRVLWFTAAVTLLTTMLFGLLPALQGSSPDVGLTLKNAPAAFALGGQIRVRRIFIFAEVALSVLLLAAAGVFARNLQNLMAVDTGIKRTNLITFMVTPSRHNYSAPRARAYYLELQDRLNHLPGVTSASAAAIPVLTGDNETATVHVEGFHPGPDIDMTPRFNEIMPQFFTTLGAPLVAGRGFSARDTAGAEKVVLVNEAFVQRYVPTRHAVGLHLGYFGQGPMDYQIIGVVKNTKQADVREKIQPATYISVLQSPDKTALPDLMFYVRTAQDPNRTMQLIRKTVAKLDPTIPVSYLKTLVQQIDEDHKVDRLLAWLATAFATSAILLTTIGLYALMSFLGTGRRTEIGIRLALGAEPRQVVRLMMRELWIIAVPGVLCGVIAAVLLGRFVQSELFGVSATDPTMLGLAAGGILLVCIAAAYLPAKQSTHLNPMQALRYE